jgi:dehydrogenase/reductase SDR family protein 4
VGEAALVDARRMTFTLDWPRPLTGRTALVTGGSRGIGLHLSWGLAAAGARVAVCARTAEDCERVVADIEEAGGEALAVVGNLADLDGVEGIVSSVVDRWGGLDVLVNNAGAAPDFGPVTSTSPRAFARTFAVNTQVPLHLIGAALQKGLGPGSSVVNVVSAGGLTGQPGMGAYGASKAAMIHATRTLARELGPQGIRVNAVAPGVIRTEFSRPIIETPQLHDKVVTGSCLGRVGEPGEVVGAVVWLASDAASYVTGTTVVVDGGFTA